MQTYNTEHQFPVTLEQLPGGEYQISYGHQVSTTTSYIEAAHMLGENLMHAAACAGEFDDDDTGCDSCLDDVSIDCHDCEQYQDAQAIKSTNEESI